jgi:hypothetical protein
MAFELFTRETAAASGKPTISIQKKGIISLNRAAYELLGRPRAVELLYDRERQLVGLRVGSEGGEHAQVVRPTTNGSAFLVSAARFAKHYGIPVDEGHRWPAEREENVILIDISKPPLD